MSQIESSLKKLRKRDGRIVDFDDSRIISAADRALRSSGTANEKVAKRVARDVIEELVDKGYDQPDQIPDQELVQDLYVLW